MNKPDNMDATISPALLFVVDDGWRHEKQVIFRYLGERLPIKILTHDARTYDLFRQEYDITLLPVQPVKRHPLYAPVMFFARELDTVLTRRHRADWLQRQPAFVRWLQHVRSGCLRAGLCRYDYAQALAWLYRGSNLYSKLLQSYRVLVYNPVFVQDKRIIFEARAAGLRIISWIYSWDNPLKDNEFLRNADAYLAWNAESREDVAALHGIPRERIHIVGAAQMDYLLGRPEKTPVPPERRYVLYPCANGKPVFVEQEVQWILVLRDLLDSIDPSVDLVVRPYPFRLDLQHNPYALLERRSGIDVAYFGKIEDERLVIDAQVEHERYLQFRDALCMINLGSTIGLEAAFSCTPILQLAFCDVPAPSPDLALNRVFQHEHLKYLIDRRFPNVVDCRTALERALREILAGRTAPYRAYSETLRRFVDPLKAASYKRVLAHTLQRLAAEWSDSA